jgi:serine/threonine-protein kinase
MIGTLLDRRYKITKFLSEGAFGKTFLAEDTKRPQNPICVIKQFKPKQFQPELLIKAKELFEREAEALESLGKHSQIPSLLAHLKIDQEFYLVEEYIAGKTLAEEFVEKPNMTEQEVISIVSELLEIIIFIHSHNIIHRDIKPSNIIRNQENNKLVLIDFGAVMEYQGETFLGTIIGTLGYISVEQSLGMTGLYSDIYAVGMIGIQALTGINPNLLDKDNNDEIIWQDKVEIGQILKNILTKMVRANKKERYATGQEVLRDINLISNAEKNREIPTVINTPINTDTANRRRNIDLVKKLVLPSLAMLAAIPLFLWIKISLLTSSSTTLSLNGKVISQELNADNLCQDSILEAGIYCQKYTFDGEQKREIVIDMNSNNFDSFLILQNPNGDKLEINGDRSINNSNAQIKVQLPSSGKYTVIARTTYPGESGEYTIRARYNN